MAALRISLATLLVIMTAIRRSSSSLAPCDLSNGCSEFFKPPPTNVFYTTDQNLCLFCAYKNFSSDNHENWRDGETRVNLNPMVNCNCDITRGSEYGSSLCVNGLMEDVQNVFYDCFVSIGAGNQCCARTKVTVAKPAEISYNTSQLVDAVNDGSATMAINIDNVGVPAATFQWVKDGEPLMDPRYKASDSSLTITGLNSTDRAEYRVIASNVAENKSLSFFLRVPGPPVIEDIFEENGKLVCQASAWPMLTDLTWLDSTGEILGHQRFLPGDGNLGRGARSEYNLSPGCLNQRLVCRAGNLAGSVQMIYNCDDLSPPVLTVRSVGKDGLLIEWDQEEVSVTRYQFNINPLGSGSQGTITMSVDGDTLEMGRRYSLFVDGLEENTEYSVVVISIRGDKSKASGTKLVFTSTGPDVVTNVKAQSISGNIEKIELSWDSVATATHYFVYVGSEDKVDKVNVTSGLTTHTFENLDCNEVYKFTVQAVNDFGLSKNSSVVEESIMCTTHSSDYIYLTEVSPGVKTINVDFIVRAGSALVSINITITEIPEGQQFIYEASDVSEYSLCLGSLSSETTYDLCVLAIFASGSTAVGCSKEQLTTLAEGEEDRECSDPLPFVTTMEPTRDPGQTLLLWLVPVVVIIILALMAMLCTLGVCVACRSDGSKGSMEFGSNSSIDTAGGNVQVANPHFHGKASSPSRSCLSYNTHSHNINWSQHMDTIRQMNSEGTHV